MNYLKLPGMDAPVSVFAICLAHQMLEADYNVGGFLEERPSNMRRMSSTGVQLARMKFDPGCWVVTFDEVDDDDQDDEGVRDIYCRNVLNWSLPIDETLRLYMERTYVPEFLNQYENWRKANETL